MVVQRVLPRRSNPKIQGFRDSKIQQGFIEALTMCDSVISAPVAHQNSVGTSSHAVGPNSCRSRLTWRTLLVSHKTHTIPTSLRQASTKSHACVSLV